MKDECGKSLESNLTAWNKKKRNANKLSVNSDREKNEHYIEYIANGHKLIKQKKKDLQE